MGRKGGKNHLKRLPAPTFWPIHKKAAKWSIRPSPGPHKISQCLPLLLIVRDILEVAKTRREAKIVLSDGGVKVDGRIRRNDDYPIGIMDVIEIPRIKKAYRVLPATRKGLVLHSISGEEQEFKLCQIMNKTIVKDGHVQLNLHDGRNILIQVEDPQDPKEDLYKTHDTLKIQIPDTEILDALKFEEGILALVTRGKNMGRWGDVTQIEKREGVSKPVITLKDSDDQQFQTIINYVFPIGKGVPWISLLKEEEP